MKVVEKTGTTMKGELQTSNLFRSRRMICVLFRGFRQLQLEGHHTRRPKILGRLGITYKIECRNGSKRNDIYKGNQCEAPTIKSWKYQQLTNLAPFSECPRWSDNEVPNERYRVIQGRRKAMTNHRGCTDRQHGTSETSEHRGRMELDQDTEDRNSVKGRRQKGIEQVIGMRKRKTGDLKVLAKMNTKSLRGTDRKEFLPNK